MSRILLLIPALNAGGAERVMVTLANEWSKDNDVTLMVFNDGSCFYSLSDRVHVKPMNLMPAGDGILRILSIPSIERKRYITIKKEILTGGYDFTLSFCYTTNLMASLVASKHKEKTIIVSERNDPSEYSGKIRFLINKLYRKCSIVVCQNSMVRDYFQVRGFKNKLLVLPNPVNFADIPTERPYNIEKSIVTVGRLIDQKNHALLIDAFADISNEYPDYTLKIYGIGPLELFLKDKIKRYNLEDKIFLMGTQKRVMFEVNKSSIFVLPSNFEGFPNVLIEAMATGMPVISSDFKTGIARELINDGVNGYLFPVGDKNNLILCIRKMLQDSENHEYMGAKNRLLAEQYKDEIIADRWLKVLYSR